MKKVVIDFSGIGERINIDIESIYKLVLKLTYNYKCIYYCDSTSFKDFIGCEGINNIWNFGKGYDHKKIDFIILIRSKAKEYKNDMYYKQAKECLTPIRIIKV